MTELTDFSKLCVHTQTTKHWSIEECIAHFSKSGVRGISIWRHLLEGKDLKKIKTLLEINQMEPVSLVRGGFSPFSAPGGRFGTLGPRKIDPG